MTGNLLTLDANILIYSVDKKPESEKKLEISSLILQKSVQGGCILTSQTLGEFYHASTRKRYIPQNKAIEMIHYFMELFPIVSSTSLTLERALLALPKYQLQFWDAMLWATAKESKCSLIITEDFQDRQSIEGVQFINPFKDDNLSYLTETYF